VTVPVNPVKPAGAARRFRRAGLALAAVLILGMLAGVRECRRRAAVPVFPEEEWAWQTPARAGFSGEKLEEFAQAAGGTGCLVRGGRMFFAWGEMDQRQNAASSIKPIYAYLVYKAIEQGLIGSVDDPVVNWVPELNELNAELDFKDREITFRHLLEQTSGYGLEEEPGEAFAYNDYGTGLLVWTLFYRVYGRTPREYDELLNGEWLGEVLGFEDEPTAVSPRNPRGRIRISTRDMARFALLYLRGGEWAGRRMLRQDLFQQALSPPLPDEFPRTVGEDADVLEKLPPIGGGRDEKHHAGSLGQFWWFNDLTPDGTRLLPDAPPGTFLGMGYGGRSAMVVIPELDLVVVWHNIYKHSAGVWSPFDEIGRFKVNALLRELLAARKNRAAQEP
jgi:CubicO group peptidase (beta-lactamase class C family)